MATLKLARKSRPSSPSAPLRSTSWTTIRSGPTLASPTSTESTHTASPVLTPVTPLSTDRRAFSVDIPTFPKTDDRISVQSDPVSRINVTGPAPLILALTMTGEPEVKGIFAGPLGDVLGRSSSGAGGGVGTESACALER